MSLALGLLLALSSAGALNWSFFTQHGASNTLAPLRLRHPLAALVALFTNWRWLVAFAVGMGGWGLYVVALFFAPISLVQAVSAGGVGLLALLVWRVAGVALSRRDRWAVAACLGGLALLLVSFVPGVPKPAAPGSTGILVWVLVTSAAGLLSALVGTRVLRPGAGLGAAAGLLYAAGDVSTKGAVGTALFFVPVLLACHFGGFVTLQLAYQRGTVLATAGLSTLLTNAVPIVAGVVPFHERLPTGGFGAARVAGFVLVVAGAALLARREEATPTTAAAGAPDEVGAAR